MLKEVLESPGRPGLICSVLGRLLGLFDDVDIGIAARNAPVDQAGKGGAEGAARRRLAQFGEGIDRDLGVYRG